MDVRAVGFGIPVFAVTLLAVILLSVDARRRGAPGSAVVAGVVALVCGLLNFLLISIHLGAVLRQASGAAEFHYDFRFASLLLVGLFIAVPGLVCAWEARRISRGDPAARRRALWATWILLAVNAALMPLQAPAVVLGSLAAVNLAALLLLGRRPAR